MADQARQASVSEGEIANMSERPTQLDRLEPFIGRWITSGATIAPSDTASRNIRASDVYEWLPGKRFVMHPAYGRIGDAGVGGLEVIGFDPATGQFATHFFDSFGNVSTQTLICEGDTWTWRGKSVRCTGTFSTDRQTLIARHERSDDGVNWIPSMTVTLQKTN